MNQEEIELEILKNTGKVISHKTLAEEVGYSVGKVNYVLRGLIEKGLIKAERFINSDKKLQYKYLLTEKGIKEKVDITQRFIDRKKAEYDKLQAEMELYKKQYNYAKESVVK
ncbi:MarR family EPS-associated transcriptional regulator [Poseidonibacter ostreae]|uniref:MarR family EPS-associated transcriptional regulator n=1 Tax=Poseidonibacter ostreae TaxID=2654171 RepID=A0A6L4WTX6_9BACT|nr:MarR family EPS-associated transcriptional regulator [Poseidonibacter ostreae]KAB7889761.1 MarR family EPS-associated transcriptional regulator [Poseidonibacter ostreae]